MQEDSTHNENRQSIRLPLRSQVKLELKPQTLRGTTENCSATDVLILTDDCLAITVEIEDDGVVKRVDGKLVRVDCERDRGSAWAICFAQAS